MRSSRSIFPGRRSSRASSTATSTSPRRVVPSRTPTCGSPAPSRTSSPWSAGAPPRASPSCTSRGSTRRGGTRTSSPPPHDLDAITTTPVVATRADGHISVVSSSTLAAIDLADADGVELDAERHPTGRLTREANRRAVAWVEASYDTRGIEGFQLQAAGLAASRGVTAVHEMSLDAADLEVLLGHRSRLPVDVAPILASMSLPEAMERRLAAIGGDLPVDGSIGARTAALSHAYDDGADHGRAVPRRRRDGGVLPRGPQRGPPGRRARDRGPRHRTGPRHLGARVPGAGLPRTTAFPRASPPHRALRPPLGGSDRADRDAGSRRVRATRVRSALGPGRRDVRGATRPRPGHGRAPDPHDARTWDRGRRRLRLAGRASRPDARDRARSRSTTSRPSD